MAQILEVMAELSANIEGWGIGEHTTLKIFGEHHTLDYHILSIIDDSGRARDILLTLIEADCHINIIRRSCFLINKTIHSKKKINIFVKRNEYL